MARSAGQARGLAKSNDCAVDLVDEKIAALEQLPEDAAEAMRIDAIEGHESLDELVGVNGKEFRLISGAGDPQHGESLGSFPFRAFVCSRRKLLWNLFRLKVEIRHIYVGHSW